MRAERRLGLLVVAALFLVPSPPASAEPIGSKAEDVSRQADLALVRQALERGEVARALAAQGLAAGAIDERLNRLSDEDVRRLAANVAQVQAAGNVPEYIWILLAVFLAVSILAMIF
jgi:hypothetical protein